jgi:ATP-binding cassette subfamily B protein
MNFGDENGTEEDWKEALRISCSDEFVEKKEGVYHAAVAQGGTNFSGGQRQRLAIARAVMKKPEVYIFDDSFSALDMKTDKQLRQNLKESMGDATMIVVAQRVNTIMDATRILVLENGEVVGQGTHRQLLESCRLYREIAQIQLGKEEVENELKRS